MILFYGLGVFAQQVGNIRVTQEGDNAVITYDLTGGRQGQTYDVAVICSDNGGQSFTIKPVTVSGDLKNVSPGTNKRVVWQVLNDLEQLVGDNFVFKVDATAKNHFGDIEMVFVPGGTFQMGSENGDSDETPVHSVTVSDFYIGKYEVTQAQWQAVMGRNPSYFKGSNHPVEKVSWNDVQEFIKKLNQQTGKNFRLPTEAEWEYAARGGNKSRGYKYSGSNTIGEVAWYGDNSGKTTHPVGQKQGNELGIYDMSGNVWEWCADWYGKYNSSPASNPRGPSSGTDRVGRGGSWLSNASFCRVAYRDDDGPGGSSLSMGFRLAHSSR